MLPLVSGTSDNAAADAASAKHPLPDTPATDVHALEPRAVPPATSLQSAFAINLAAETAAASDALCQLNTGV